MSRTRTAALLVAVGVATIGVYVTAFVLDTTRDAPDKLDVEPVRARAEAACTRLRTALDALPPLPPGAPAQQRTDRVGAQDAAVRALVADVRALGPATLAKDVPAEQWLGDWTALSDARGAWARAGATGAFVPPSADGFPITRRMGDIGIASCAVPDALTAAP